MQEFIVGQSVNDAESPPAKVFFNRGRFDRTRWQIPKYLGFLTFFCSFILIFVLDNTRWDAAEFDVLLNYPGVCGLSVFHILMTICGAILAYISLSLWVDIKNPGVNTKRIITLRHSVGLATTVVFMLTIVWFNSYVQRAAVGEKLCWKNGRTFSIVEWKWMIGRHDDKISPLISSALPHACLLRNEELFDFLIAQGADVNKGCRQGSPLYFLSYDASFVPPYTNNDAFIEQTRRIYKKLLVLGADINQPNIMNGKTPLHKLVEWAPVELVENYLRAGANINVKNDWGLTPLDIADEAVKQTREGSKAEFARAQAVVELLKSHGAKTGKEIK